VRKYTPAAINDGKDVYCIVTAGLKQGERTASGLRRRFGWADGWRIGFAGWPDSGALPWAAPPHGGWRALARPAQGSGVALIRAMGSEQSIDCWVTNGSPWWIVRRRPVVFGI